MESIETELPEDPQEAEKTLIRMVTDAYRFTPSWRNDQVEIAAIEMDIENVTAPAALGLSSEFERWDRIATAAGVIWEVSDEGFVKVSF
jgi:hypothetical protein